MKIYKPFEEKVKNQKNQQFRVIISFDNLSDREDFLKNNEDLKILGKFDLIPSIYVNLVKEKIINYSKSKLIKKIEEDQKLYQSILDVLEILEINNYKNSQISYTGKNVNVGIIDDGIDVNFSSITKNILKYPFFNRKAKNYDLKDAKDKISHGTLMASIICNQFKNADNNYIGIAPDANIIDFDIFNVNREYYFSNILKVFDKIISENINVDILLISLNSKDSSDGKDILSLACDLLVEHGIVVVCSSGNFGPDPYTIGSPGAAEKIIAVGALTKNLIITNFSGRGPTLDNRIKPDICLHGSNVIVPISQNLRVKLSGTSVSASICAGFIALMKEYNPKMGYNDIIQLIKKSSRDLNYDSNAQGLGILRIIDVFKELDLYHEKLFPYNYLVKRSLIFSIEFFIIFVFIFYFVYFFNSWNI
ncbi:MAG: S8 family serine peptidase [Promethearchaeota archaeon]